MSRRTDDPGSTGHIARTEAESQGVLPLDDRTIELFGARFRDGSPHPVDRHYTYLPPMTQLPAQVAPALGGRSWELLASTERPAGAGGVLYASGTQNSGLSLFVQGDRLVFDYNCFGDHHVVESDRAVPVGDTTLGVRFRRTGGGATITLVVDDEPVGSMEVPFAMQMISSTGPSVGLDHGSPVSLRYTGPFPFEGDLRRIDVQLLTRDQTEDADAAAADARSGMSRQ